MILFFQEAISLSQHPKEINLFSTLATIKTISAKTTQRGVAANTRRAERVTLKFYWFQFRSAKLCQKHHDHPRWQGRGQNEKLQQRAKSGRCLIDSSAWRKKCAKNKWRFIFVCKDRRTHHARHWKIMMWHCEGILFCKTFPYQGSPNWIWSDREWDAKSHIELTSKLLPHTHQLLSCSILYLFDLHVLLPESSRGLAA